MNNSTQAQKGFKTFLLTLSISLIVFSVVYYVITSTTGSVDSLPADVAEEQTNVVNEEASADENVFEKLATAQMNVESRAVLAGSDSQTTQSTTAVPDTGVVGVTFGLFTAGMLFVLAMLVVAKDPRKLAIQSFEKRTIKKL